MFLYSAKTYENIIDLLDQLERSRRTQDLMSEGGMIGRTEAGSRFFLSKSSESLEITKELNTYPYGWVQSVRHILSLRNGKASNLE